MPNVTTMAIVTGAASGIGRACANLLASEGYRVGLLDQDSDGLAATAEDIAKMGSDPVVVTVDLCDEQSVIKAIETVATKGKLRALVNLAGLHSIGTATDISMDEWDRVVGVKLRGYFLTSRIVLPYLARAGGGAIVNVASMSGRTKSLIASPAYTSANAGVIGLTMTMAAQSAKIGVRVNCVAPGMVNTPMLNPYRPEQLEAYKAAIPLGRIAEAIEIATVINFLCRIRPAISLAKR